MRIGVRIAAAAWAAFMALPASAACSGPVAEPAPQTPLEEAFARALARDRYADSAGQANDWRALLARAERAGGVGARWDVRGQTRLAWSLDYSDQAEAALEVGEGTLVQIAQAGLTGTALEAEALTVMATILTDTKQNARAEDSARRALVLAEATSGAQSAAASFAHNGLGTVAYAQGRYSEAEREYGIAADLAARCQDPADPAVVNQMASHAGTLFMVGQLEAALTEAKRAANHAAAHLPEDSPLQTLALGNLGAILLTTGRYAEAQKALARVVELEGAYQAESWHYRAISLSNYAGVLRRLGRLEEAETLWLEAAQFHERASIGRDPASASFPLRNAADAAQERGDLAVARERRDAAVAIVDKALPEDDPERARTHMERALTRLAQGNAQAALAEAVPAMTVLRSRFEADDVRRMPLEIGEARILAALGRQEEAWARVQSVAQRLETRLLDAAASRGDLVRFAPTFAPGFAVAADLALRTGREEAAFRYLQLANMSDIVVVTREVAARAAAANAQTADLVRNFQDRLYRRRALERENSFALSAGEGPRAARLAAEIAANDSEIAALEQRLEREVPSLRTLGRPEPVALADYRAGLAPDEALLAPLLLEDHVVTILVTREGLVWGQSAQPRSTVRGQLRTLRASLDPASPRAIAGEPPVFAYEAAHGLYQALFPDELAEVLAGHRDLVYFAGGDLAGLPPALLVRESVGRDGGKVDPGQVAWLVREHSVRVAPSLLMGEQASRSEAGRRRFLGVGAPVRGPSGSAGVDLSDLAPLPGAARELEALASVFGQDRATLLVGEEAREEALAALPLEDYDILAFAVHGLAGGTRAGLEEPALVLAPGRGEGAAADGLLMASEVMRLRLDADWVILSACDTASGGAPGAPIFAGLAAAFLHAGAHSLLVSHWPVRDDVAAQLVVRALEEHARGRAAARALQSAQLELIAGRGPEGAAQPGNWAAMVLVGH